jgi:hypothetical protein
MYFYFSVLISVETLLIKQSRYIVNDKKIHQYYISKQVLYPLERCQIIVKDIDNHKSRDKEQIKEK